MQPHRETPTALSKEEKIDLVLEKVVKLAHLAADPEGTPLDSKEVMEAFDEVGDVLDSVID